ncbi:hypothetical protein FJT64_013109 [Amphibalanus amphitrite]|uniref:DUF7027 domain-containing protein n=1 Tax=Amphibalanus amphitrite TaxID=1232801 RepID=A0A6A4VDR5_AMPAM|nr:hypothetical protein FJT64_013109 [Amphibalanus amphitrite]
MEVFKREHRAYAWFIITVVVGLFVFFIPTVKNLNNFEEFLDEQYCQLNSLVKSEPDEVHGNYTNPCSSEIVLNVSVDDLRSPLLGPLVMQAIVTLALIPTSALAIYGTRKTKAKHMYPWLIVNGLWVICLIIRMIILGSLGLTNYALFLLLPFGIAVLSLVDVGLFTLNILRTTGSYEVKPVPMQDFSDGHASAPDPEFPGAD